MLMLVGSEAPTAANYSDALAQLDLRERLLRREEIQAIFRELAALGKCRLALSVRAASLSEALEGHLTALEIEQSVSWQLRCPGAPTLLSYVAVTHEAPLSRRRMRRRSERTIELVVESLVLKAEGMPARMADEWVTDWAKREAGLGVLRKRVRDDARRLDADL